MIKYIFHKNYGNMKYIYMNVIGLQCKQIQSGLETKLPV